MVSRSGPVSVPFVEGEERPVKGGGGLGGGVSGVQGEGPQPGVKRADIQWLRALAVTLVVLYHAAPGVVPGGYVGVDIFFVISGFLITSGLIKRPPLGWRGLGDFWARRIRRLLPAAFLVIVVTSVAAYWFGPSTQWLATLRS
ncbi:MAG: acyltransferase, partial [Bifidobacteriaceae bacterium]|nr:acyltransferase [Bifidobacteriaceae bacterium]